MAFRQRLPKSTVEATQSPDIACKQRQELGMVTVTPVFLI